MKKKALLIVIGFILLTIGIIITINVVQHLGDKVFEGKYTNYLTKSGYTCEKEGVITYCNLKEDEIEKKITFKADKLSYEVTMDWVIFYFDTEYPKNFYIEKKTNRNERCTFAFEDDTMFDKDSEYVLESWHGFRSKKTCEQFDGSVKKYLYEYYDLLEKYIEYNKQYKIESN